MNKNDRIILKKAVETLTEVQQAIEEMSQSEQDKYDNLPEGLQCADMGDKLSENASELEDISSEIEEIIGRLDELIC